MGATRHIPAAAAVFGVLATAVAVAIFVLTEQPPEVTSAESGWVDAFLLRLFGGATWLYDPDTGLWLGIGIRHWAHTVEFGLLGVFVALAVHFAGRAKAAKPAKAQAAGEMRRRSNLLREGGISLAICVAYSLFDQCHKLFVPGRHWDTFDLVMDAGGYLVAIALVLLACRLAPRRT